MISCLCLDSSHLGDHALLAVKPSDGVVEIATMNSVGLNQLVPVAVSADKYPKTYQAMVELCRALAEEGEVRSI